jgi:DNA-binding response OmpR family regulator
MRALETYKEVQPDLVLLDIGLPDMTGWKVLDAIKESKSIFKRPSVIVMTAYGDPANRLMGKLQGVDEYLIKPFTPEEIEHVVRQVLQT